MARFAALSVALALAGCSKASGPEPIAWDREACARCRMLVSEPAFAAQLRTATGEVRSYDDPGCLLLHLDETGVEAKELWFHHHREERWLAGAATGFVEVPASPMGFRLGAVDAGTPGALSLDEARRRVRQVERVRGPR